jgi:hypothetical protein
MAMTVAVVDVADRQIRQPLSIEAVKRESCKADSILAKVVPRKTSRAKVKASVLKPTQVDEASSLRCTRETSLRNSAKKRP